MQLLCICRFIPAFLQAGSTDKSVWEAATEKFEGGSRPEEKKWDFTF